MKYAGIALALVVTSVASGTAEIGSAALHSEPADLVFRHGAVYTVDAPRSWAEAVAVSRGRICFVGTDREVQSRMGKGTYVVDLRGQMLLPGFHDSHVHPIAGGIDLGECNLTDATNQLQIVEMVRAYAREHVGLPCVRGAGWQLPIFPKANPHKKVLDEIVADRPVYLISADGHSAWVNSRALELAGITKATPNSPAGHSRPGIIERDAATGEPSGTLREGAMLLVSERLPKYTQGDYVQGLRRYLKLSASFGITSLQEARADEHYLEAYEELDRRGELTAHVVAAAEIDVAKGTEQVEHFEALRRKYHRRRYRTTAVKIFADGVIESRTAALLEPYTDTSDDFGKANIEPDVLNRLVEALDRLGFQIHVHAIGDRAIRNSLNAFEYARQRNGPRDSRHHIAHLELINPMDIPRFRKLGVIANFQPLWAYADSYIKDLTLPVLGPNRSRWLYPIRSVANSGAVLVCGSDWDVTSMNPLECIQVGITRRGLAEEPGPAWIPEETVDLSTLLAGYTINGAYLSFEETDTGSIEVGKLADLVIINRNLFEVPPREIHQCKVLLTLLEGKMIYRDPDFEYAGP
jgi:predicted amidohydrolase YtcJ